MGKGDLKTFRGKLHNHSYGIKRPRKIKRKKMKQKSATISHNEKGTIGESFVNELVFKAYLKFWCYPNPIDLEGDKKEICDLLILFFDTIIIISVKNYNLKGNYKRFKKRVIDKSTNQLFGAERKLFNSNHSIKIQHPDKGIEIFDPKKYKWIFRITVTLGRDIDDYEFIDTKVGKGFINILNKETFSAITKELDTIKDLVEYLKLRESVFSENIGIFPQCTEKDLLAYYLMSNREFPASIRTNFVEETIKLKNKWRDYVNNRSVIFKKLADEKSYFIDELIKNDVLKIENGEILAAELMTLSRFERRLIANNLFEIVNKFQNEKDFYARRFTKYNDVGFLFIYYPIERQQVEIDILNQHATQLYSFYYKTDKIVLLAASKNFTQWKFGLYITTSLTEKQELFLKNLAEAYGWFKNENKIEKIVKEYPDN